VGLGEFVDGRSLFTDTELEAVSPFPFNKIRPEKERRVRPEIERRGKILDFLGLTSNVEFPISKFKFSISLCLISSFTG